MTALITVLGYVAVILIGIFIRAQGLVPRDLAKPVGFLVLNITLPCAIITFLNGVTLPVELLATILIPITATWIMIGIAWLMTHRSAFSSSASLISGTPSCARAAPTPLHSAATAERSKPS